jgi:hypothetical protein
MDKGGYVLVLRRLAIIPPGRPDTGLPLPLAILVEALRDRSRLSHEHRRRGSPARPSSGPEIQ